MVKLEDPTIPFAGVVARRRAERAGADSVVFRLGAPGRDWDAIYPEPGPKAIVGASDAALGADWVEDTMQVVGSIGGLLADLGFQVCPASALTAGTIRPSLLAWVAHGGAAVEERRALDALGAPGVMIGPCGSAPVAWVCIDEHEFNDRNQFIRRFVAEVSDLVDLHEIENVSNNLSNEPRRTEPDDAGRTVLESAADLHVDARRRTRRHPPERGASDS
ncbi:MAG: hypothetical protein H0W70_01550 [Actinobacteria bacterium]|nr:hypothetical protein [Actinomycetota bacterium]